MSRDKPSTMSYAPISSKTKSLIQVFGPTLEALEDEESPQELDALVQAEGVNGALVHAHAFASSRKWNAVERNLRSMLHRLDSSPMSFLELWLDVCANKEEALCSLYEKKSSFLHAVWKKNVGNNLFQIHHEGVQYFALGGDRLALAHGQGVRIYSFQTGAHIASILLHSVQNLCFVDKDLYILSADMLYCWNGESCTQISDMQIHNISSYADWLAIQAVDGHVFIQNEDFSFDVPILCTVMEFCQRGLALALGTEYGDVFLCVEDKDTPQKISVMSRMPITALHWESHSRLWIGDEEGGVWLWDGTGCVMIAQHHSRIMALGMQDAGITVVTSHGKVVGHDLSSWIPEPYSVQVHESTGVIGLFPRHRFCQFLPDMFSGVQRAYLVDGKLWWFHDRVECISCSDWRTIYTGPLPEYTFSSMGGDVALDIQGGVWNFDTSWKKVAQCTVRDIQKSWFYGESIYILGASGLLRCTRDGVLCEEDRDVQCCSTDGLWRIKQDGTLLKEGVFQRHFARSPSHMMARGERVIISQGAILSVYRGEHQEMIYHAQGVITGLAGHERYVAISCANRCVEVVDIMTNKRVGSYATSAAVIDIVMDSRLRILIHQADGSIALVILDGVQR